MSAFLTAGLQIDLVDDISHDGQGTWVLLNPIIYQSDILKELIIVPRGFVTDLASVPRLPFAYLATGNTSHRAAVLHDWLYTSHEVSRLLADEVFREASLVCKIPHWRVWVMYQAVRIAGQESWDRIGSPQPPRVAYILDQTGP